MRIITKFKDYYDSAMSLGIDDSITYLRKTEEFEMSAEDLGLDRRVMRPGIYNYNSTIGIYKNKNIKGYEFSFLLFCGKAYPIINYTHTENNRDIDGILLGFDAIEEFFNILNGDSKYSLYTEDIIILRNLQLKLSEKFILEQHLKYNSPSILYNKKGTGSLYKITKDVCLKELCFYREFDSYSAFQEISMFMGSVLCNNQTPDMPVGGDDVILKSKGFDHKYGFRKRPK